MSRSFRFLALALLFSGLIHPVWAGSDFEREILVMFRPGILLLPQGQVTTDLEHAPIASSQIRQALSASHALSLEKVFKDAAPEDTMRHSRTGEKVRIPNFSYVYKVSFPSPQDARQALLSLNGLPGMDYAEPNGGPATLDVIPNDDFFGSQFGLHPYGSPRYDIHAVEAWDISHGAGALVAVVDAASIDRNHIDLASKVTGDDTENKDHATKIAGVIGALTNNDEGIAGTSWNARLLSKAFGGGDDAAKADKIRGAVNDGASIINLSWHLGGCNPYQSITVRLAIVYGYQMGRLFVATMGNDETQNPYFPAAHNEYVMAVGAYGRDGRRSSGPHHNNISGGISQCSGVRWGSNIGYHIDLIAPGSFVTSTVPGGGYSFNNLEGTSFAAPFVAGVSDLLLGVKPDLYNDDLRWLMNYSADDVTRFDGLNGGNLPVGWDQFTGWGQLRADKALSLLRPPYIYYHLTTSLTPVEVIYETTFEWGEYQYRTHKVVCNVNFPFRFNPSLSVYAWGVSAGSSGRIRNPYRNLTEVRYGPYCELVQGSTTPSGCQLVTYVHKVYDISGGFVEWYPYNPHEVPTTLSYSVVGIPQTPQTPSDLISQYISENSVELHWRDNSNFETGYAVYRSTTPGSYGDPVAVLPANATFWTDNGLSRGSQYYFVVKAIHYTIYSSPSNELSVSTFWLNTPIAIQASTVSYDKIKVRFHDMSRFERRYIIWRGTDGTHFQDVDSVSGLLGTGIIDCVNEGLSPSTRYWYKVQGYDQGSHLSFESNVVSATTYGYLSSIKEKATAWNANPKLVRDARGWVHVAYWDGLATDYGYTTDNGFVWNEFQYFPSFLVPDTATTPSLAVGLAPDYKVYIAFRGLFKSNLRPGLWLGVRSAQGTWVYTLIDGRNMGDIPGYIGPPAMVLDRGGDPHIVWEYFAPGAPDPSGIYHGWLEGATARKELIDAFGVSYRHHAPSIAVDGGDTLRVLCEEVNGFGLLRGAGKAPGTGAWFDMGYVNDTPEYLSQYRPFVSTEGVRARVAWDDDFPGPPKEIYTADFVGPTSQGWGSPVKVYSSASDSVNWPVLTGDRSQYCVFNEKTSGNWEVYYSQRVGDVWSPKVNISQSSVSSKYPHAIFYYQKKPVYSKYLGVVWTEGTSSPDRFQVKYQSLRLPWDVAWSSSCEATGYNNAKRFLADGPGNLYLAYTSKDSVFFISSTDGGDSWSEPKSLGQGSSPALNLDGSGNPCVTWRVMDVQAQRLHVYFARRVQSVWRVSEAGDLPMPGIAYITPFSVAVGQGDTAHVCFEYIDLGLVEPWKIFYGNFLVSSPQIASLTVLDSLAVGPDSLPVSPSVCLDGRGVVHCVWSDPGGEVQYRKRVQGVFSPKVNLSNSPGTASIHPTISAFGPVAVAWQEEVSPGAPDIFYRNLGDSLFSPIQNLSNTPSASSESPVISGAGVLWSEAVNGDYEVYETKFDSETMTWTAPGSASVTDANSKHPQVALFQKEQSAWAYTVWTEEVVPGRAYQILFTGQELPSQPAYALDLGQGQPSPFVVQRDGYIQYGSEPFRTVDYDTTELVYHLSNLNPYKRDKLVLSFYQESGQDWKLKLWADQVSLGMVHVPAGQEVVFEKWLPPNVYGDGEVTLRIVRERGDFAVLGKLLVYEYAHGGGGGGPQSTEGALPIPLPSVFALGQSYPNPMRDNAAIRYQLPVESRVSLKLYNVLGQVIRELASGKQKAGYYNAVWDGKDASGRLVSSGVYFYRLDAGGFTKTNKLVMVR